MRMLGQLGRVDGNACDTALLTDDIGGKSKAGALMDGYASSQVGKPECGLSVSAISGTEQREENLVSRDRKKASIAKMPASWIEAKADQADFAYERLTHG